MRAHLVAALLVALLGLPGLQAQACNSVGVSPIRIDLSDAQPGQSYIRQLSIQNPCEYGRDVSIAADGQAGTWVTTEPGAKFHLDALSNRDVAVTVTIPSGTGPGTRTGHVTFVGAAVDTGSESHVAVGVSIPLNVTVGGVAIVQLAWGATRAADVDTLESPRGYAKATNNGNVAATARMAATVSLQGQTEVLAQGNGSKALTPGETAEVPVAFDTQLPVGQYVMRFESVEPAGHGSEVQFKVTAPGERPPSGTLLAIQHIAYGTVGQPLRIDGTFRNDGQVTIHAAQLFAEVRQGGALVAPLESPPLAVPVGATVNLTTYWTPTEDGTFDLVGHVLYDGYQTPDSESPINVNPGPGGIPWWVWLVLALVVIGGLATAWLLLRPKNAKPPAPARPPPDARSPQPWQKRR